MIRAYSRYGALRAKAMAMYGNRLRAAQYRHIAGLADLDAVLDYLATLPGWADTVQTLRATPRRLDRALLEGALRDKYRQEYLRLLAFVPGGERAGFSFPVRQAELDALLAAISHIQIGDALSPDALSPFLEESDLSPAALCGAASYDGLLAVARSSLYYPALVQLRSDTGGPPQDMAAAGTLLQSCYFANLYKTARRAYTGEVRALLGRALGEEADLLNLIHLLRLKTYFPQVEDLEPYLLPFHYRLKPAFLHRLCQAPDADALSALLSDSPYAAAFAGVKVQEVEDRYRHALYRFNRRQLMLGRPSVYSAISYLNLRQLETTALINAVETVKYGGGSDEAFWALIGD